MRFLPEREGTLSSLPQEQSLATGRLHSRMKSQQNCLQAEKPPGDTKGKSFTWGEGTCPGSPNSPQAENMISGKKYSPEGRMLSTACIQRRERRPDGENPGAQRGPTSANSPCLQHRSLSPTLGATALSTAHPTDSTPHSALCRQTSNSPFLLHVYTTLLY